MFLSLGHIHNRLFDIHVDSIEQCPLDDDELVEFFVDLMELVN